MQLVEGQEVGPARRRRRLHLPDGGGVGPKPVGAVHQRHMGGPIRQLMRPIERRVASADDDDPPAAEFVGIEHHLIDAPPVPGLGERVGEPARRECPDPGGDHQRA